MYIIFEIDFCIRSVDTRADMSREELFDKNGIKNSEEDLRNWLLRMGVDYPDRFVLDHVRHILGQPKSKYLMDSWNIHIRRWSDYNTEHGRTHALTIFLELIKDVLENSTGKHPEEVLLKVQNMAMTLSNMERGQRVTQVFSGNRDGVVVGGDGKEASDIIEHTMPDTTDFVKGIIGDIMRR
jgi:hypothetical protein